MYFVYSVFESFTICSVPCFKIILDMEQWNTSVNQKISCVLRRCVMQSLSVCSVSCPPPPPPHPPSFGDPGPADVRSHYFHLNI